MALPEPSSYWMKYKKPAKIDQNQIGTINAFSTVPKVYVFSELVVYENLVKITPAGYISPENTPPERTEFDIKGFSKKSRKHLFEIFNKLNYSKYGIPLFLSATWHYDAPDNMKQIKSFLEKYRQMLDRHFNKFHYIWKLEYQQRGVPHFHILLFPLNPTEKFYSVENEKFIKDKWNKLKVCKCIHCKNYSMKVIECRTRKMSIAYISKEIAKVEDRYEEHDLGRIFGTSQGLKTEPLKTLKLNEDVWNKIIDMKLQEKFSTDESKNYVESMKSPTEPRSLFIDYKIIEELIRAEEIKGLTNFKQLKKYNLRRLDDENRIISTMPPKTSQPETDIF